MKPLTSPFAPNAKQRPFTPGTRPGQEGFTLVQSMVLMGLLLIMIGTMSSWHYQRAKQMKMANDKKNLSQVQNSIKAAAGQSESITQTEELVFDPTLPTPTPSPTP